MADTHEDSTEHHSVSLDDDLRARPARGPLRISLELSQRQARSLYLSHALSTWNARTYEFAAVGQPCRISTLGPIDMGVWMDCDCYGRNSRFEALSLRTLLERLRADVQNTDSIHRRGVSGHTHG